jgi:hypothetical protein
LSAILNSAESDDTVEEGVGKIVVKLKFMLEFGIVDATVDVLAVAFDMLDFVLGPFLMSFNSSSSSDSSESNGFLFIFSKNESIFTKFDGVCGFG